MPHETSHTTTGERASPEKEIEVSAALVRSLTVSGLHYIFNVTLIFIVFC